MNVVRLLPTCLAELSERELRLALGRGAEDRRWLGAPLPGTPLSRAPAAELLLRRAGPELAAKLRVGARSMPLASLELAGLREVRWTATLERPSLLRQNEGRSQRARRIGVVGASRLGALVAEDLARAGFEELVLVDPDRFDEHHLEAVEWLRPEHVGTLKARALARHLGAHCPSVRVHAIPCALQEADAWRALVTCDLLCTAPDRDEPRLGASLLASAYLLPVLDFGTGVFHRDGGFEAGADLRLVLPGDGCLLCIGGLELERRSEVDWRRERAGSLRSLNGLAVSFGLELLAGALRGEIQRSTWRQMRFERDGELLLRELPALARARCPICALRAHGEAALGALGVGVGGR